MNPSQVFFGLSFIKRVFPQKNPHKYAKESLQTTKDAGSKSLLRDYMM